MRGSESAETKASLIKRLVTEPDRPENTKLYSSASSLMQRGGTHRGTQMTEMETERKNLLDLKTQIISAVESEATGSGSSETRSSTTDPLCESDRSEMRTLQGYSRYVCDT